MNKLEEFKELLSHHDWYYMMSDDHRIWKKGQAYLAKVSGCAYSLSEEDFEKAKEHWDSVAPQKPYTSHNIPFLYKDKYIKR